MYNALTNTISLLNGSADCSTPWQITFQDPATSVMEGIVAFHHELMFFLIGIVLITLWFTLRCLSLYNEITNPTPLKFVHGTLLEVVWTVTPVFILLAIAVPSFALLYSMDEVIDPTITLKVIGHQWYWSYEYSDNNANVNFDSYMVPESDLVFGHPRLLEVDNRVMIPTNTHVRVLITSSDVLHCWAIPSLGVKLDACPGRLNQTSMFIKRDGVFYGQCSEICGINHGFMPIVVQSVSLENYTDWLVSLD
jgi:cytochrome c oxidase subunit 2